MNHSVIRYILVNVILFEGVFMIPSIIVALIYGEKEGFTLAAVMAACIAFGFIGRCFKPKSTTFYAKEGFVTVALAWMIMSIIGAIPFYVTGSIPNYIDAVFETMSGFTTSGGTILTDVEHLSKSIQFWRLFTHWLGGMGVLVLILAILPLSGSYNLYLMKAESAGPSVGKFVPKIKDTAKILYSIYLGITIIEIIALCITGLPLYDAMTLTFSTVGTGGFGLLNDSIGSYSMTTGCVIIVFMLICSINFNLYFLLLKGKIKDVFKSEELRLFFIIVIVATLAVFFNIRKLYSGTTESLYHSLFQVASIISTTGFSTVDFNRWPDFSKNVLIIITLIGACAGSTGGGFKVSRVLILYKSIKNELYTLVHPRAVKKVHVDGKILSSSLIHSVGIYLAIYVIIFGISCILLSLDGYLNFESVFTSVAANLNNVGPGFNLVGPMDGYAKLSYFSKIVLIFDMLIGRLELIPVLILFTPRTWKKLD